jgi:hypothetical protein
VGDACEARDKIGQQCKAKGRADADERRSLQQRSWSVKLRANYTTWKPSPFRLLLSSSSNFSQAYLPNKASSSFQLLARPRLTKLIFSDFWQAYSCDSWHTHLSDVNIIPPHCRKRVSWRLRSTPSMANAWIPSGSCSMLFEYIPLSLGIIVLYQTTLTIYRLYFSPLSHVPGPRIAGTFQRFNPILIRPI